MTRKFLRAIWPYRKQVSGLLFLGSLGGIVMNTAVVLPAVLLGRGIDRATAWADGQGRGTDVLPAGLAHAGATALFQGTRLVKRWGLRVSNACQVYWGIDIVQSRNLPRPTHHMRFEADVSC